MPEPTGVVAVLAPQQSSLLGLVSVLAPVLAGGNTAVVVTSKERPLPAVTLGEVLATSDVPGGVVNLLTGDADELGPWLAEHADVDAIDLCGAPSGRAMELEREAAGTVKRVLRPQHPEPDWTADPGLARMTPVPGDQDRLAPDRRLTGQLFPEDGSATDRSAGAWRAAGARRRRAGTG